LPVGYHGAQRHPGSRQHTMEFLRFEATPAAIQEQFGMEYGGDEKMPSVVFNRP